MSNIRGRFQKEPDKVAAKYSASIFIDWRLYPYDIQGSIAHAHMLGKQGIITDRETSIIVKGLESVAEEIESGEFKFDLVAAYRPFDSAQDGHGRLLYP